MGPEEAVCGYSAQPGAGPQGDMLARGTSSFSLIVVLINNSYLYGI